MNKISRIVTIFLCFVLLSYRLWYSDMNQKPLKVTTSDAFGYYMYLPKLLIYNDLQLNWVNDMDAQYGGLIGSTRLYQAGKSANGNLVCTYFSGVALMELPFFLIAHSSAKMLGFKADGFSPPYQYALVFGVLIYAFLGLFFLRRVLLRYFDDATTALTLGLLILATNAIQYISVDSLQSHSFIFPLYAFVLWTSLKWHEKPQLRFAILTGFICGLATLCRPTEAIMFLIPLLWNTHTKENAAIKWQQVRENRPHLFAAIAVGLAVLSLQFIYYKYVTGSFWHVTGSRWVFLNPFFRVLFGFEKGWFVYTPVTILFVLGLFKMRDFGFRKTVLWFSMLNIWIVISWYDWQYGGSYSTRALVQSYPVFALPFAALIDWIRQQKGRYVFYLLSIYMVGVNLFQLFQYNHNNLLHFKDMNRQYYSRIYLNSQPNALDMSLLDTDNWISNESNYQSEKVTNIDTLTALNAQNQVLISQELKDKRPNAQVEYLKIETELKTQFGFWNSYILTEIKSGETVSNTTKVRLFHALAKDGERNKYAWYIEIPNHSQRLSVRVVIKTEATDFKADVLHLKMTHFWQ
jgi:hypothetical protein